MKYKSFKYYINENESTFNSFVEKVFQNQWEFVNNQFGYFTDKYHCKDESDIYRIVFFPRQDIDTLGDRKSTVKQKLVGFLTSENQGNPRFFTKDSYENIKYHLEYLSSIGIHIHGYVPSKDRNGNILDNPETDYVGLIFSQKTGANDNIDFSFYKDGNSQVKERIDKTKPVLAINSTSIKLLKKFQFDDGWQLVDFGMDDLADYTNKEEPENNQETPEEDEEENKNEIK